MSYLWIVRSRWGSRSQSIRILGRTGQSIVGIRFTCCLAGRGTNGLRLSDEFSCGHRGSWPMFSTQKARHGRRSKMEGRVEHRATHLGSIAQSVFKNLCFGVRFGHTQF